MAERNLHHLTGHDPALAPRRTAKHCVTSGGAGERNRWSTTLSAQSHWLGRARDQTHNPSVAGSSPARPTRKTAGHTAYVALASPPCQRSAPHLPRAGHANRARICQYSCHKPQISSGVSAPRGKLSGSRGLDWPSPASGQTAPRGQVRAVFPFRPVSRIAGSPVRRLVQDSARSSTRRESICGFRGCRMVCLRGRRPSCTRWGWVGGPAPKRRYP